jgi:hypothetical protein
MDLQLMVVALAVAGAVGYLGHASWRSLRGSKRGCGGGGCACPGNSSPSQSAKSNGLIPSDQLTLRRPDPGNG